METSPKRMKDQRHSELRKAAIRFWLRWSLTLLFGTVCLLLPCGCERWLEQVFFEERWHGCGADTCGWRATGPGRAALCPSIHPADQGLCLDGPVHVTLHADINPWGEEQEKYLDRSFAWATILSTCRSGVSLTIRYRFTDNDTEGAGGAAPSILGQHVVTLVLQPTSDRDEGELQQLNVTLPNHLWHELYDANTETSYGITRLTITSEGSSCLIDELVMYAGWKRRY